ncbi:tartrate dehydrogenase [Caldifermentibacillus hisashii]|uniref:tartrate dehydrogenase n=1 Tax=Caldifermentibacillus hisashii TaxID=996558 RepID=UPI0031B77F8E
MKRLKIALIPGDGIGKEVLQEGVKVLKTIDKIDNNLFFEFEEFPWGCDYYVKNGKMMDDNGLEQLKDFDAFYLGAVGHPSVPDHVSLWDLLLKIRKGFDQYVNLREITLLNQSLTPLKDKSEEDIDFLVIRENSEGEYAGVGEWMNKGTPEEVVLQTSVFSRKGTERIIRYAFEEARRQKKSLTSISKGNALNYSMVFWDQVFNEISQEYPDVKTYSYLVDAASMYFIKEPERFEIVVTTNLFGDILTDLGAAITGGLGLAAGANINPERQFPPMFEPIHGSAPDIAEKRIANPLAAIWSVAQMMEYFHEGNWKDYIIESIRVLLKEGRYLTRDLGGKSLTTETGDRLIEILTQMVTENKSK